MDWILERREFERIEYFLLAKSGQEQYQGRTWVALLAPVLKSLALEHMFCLLARFFSVKAPWHWAYLLMNSTLARPGF